MTKTEGTRSSSMASGAGGCEGRKSRPIRFREDVFEAHAIDYLQKALVLVVEGTEACWGFCKNRGREGSDEKFSLGRICFKGMSQVKAVLAVLGHRIHLDRCSMCC